MTHDPKIDDPALLAALRSDAFYVGALGSKKTQAARRERLRAAGLGEADLARIHGRVGLPIGALSPGEIAVAVMAEMVEAARRPRPAAAGA
jgi:xanthine dehydrogenase accessory factor